MQKVIEWFSSLPGMGSKSAERIVTYLLDLPDEIILQLSRDISEMQKAIQKCSRCGNYAEADLCSVCRDPGRDKTILCVVEHPKDTFVFERSSRFKGLYHILGGKLSPLEGIGPEELNLQSLKMRVGKEKIREIVIATSADLEGEATADYIAEMFQEKKDCRVSRIAFGIPYGTTLDVASTIAVEKAFQHRITLSEEQKTD